MGITFIGNPYDSGVSPNSCTGFDCTSHSCTKVACTNFDCTKHKCKDNASTSSIEDSVEDD